MAAKHTSMFATVLKGSGMCADKLVASAITAIHSCPSRDYNCIIVKPILVSGDTVPGGPCPDFLGASPPPGLLGDPRKP
eukprot:6185992-Pleurochrysis_carterae.AAC.4